jgi:hypothetical protein
MRMDNLNDNEPPVQPTVWPPVPEQSAAVWPPAPTTIPRQTYNFKTLFARVTGSVPDFRSGVMGIDGNGMSVEGSAVRPSEIQVPILILSFFICFLLGYIILEYVARIQARLFVPWDSITNVVLVPNKKQVCVTYTAPNYKGVVKPFSLATKLTPEQYETFAGQCRTIVPDKVVDGKLKSWNSPAVILFLIGLALNILYVVNKVGHH